MFFVARQPARKLRVAPGEHTNFGTHVEPATSKKTLHQHHIDLSSSPWGEQIRRTSWSPGEKNVVLRQIQFQDFFLSPGREAQQASSLYHTDFDGTTI